MIHDPRASSHRIVGVQQQCQGGRRSICIAARVRIQEGRRRELAKQAVDTRGLQI